MIVETAPHDQSRTTMNEIEWHNNLSMNKESPVGFYMNDIPIRYSYMNLVLKKGNFSWDKTIITDPQEWAIYALYYHYSKEFRYT